MRNLFALLPKRLLANSTWLLLTRLSSQALAIVFTILVARKLGEAGLGQYAFIAAVLFIGNVVTTFGMDTLLIREVARSRSTDLEILPAALGIQLALSVLFMAVIFLLGSRLSSKTPETVLALKLYSFSLLPLAFTTVYSAVLRAFERMDLYLLLNFVAAACQALFALAILLKGGGLLALTWGLLAVQALSAIVGAWLCARWIPSFSFRWRASLPSLQAALFQGWPLASLSGLAVVYQRLGILMLSFLSADAVVGWFSAAARIVEAFKIVNYAFFGAIFPVLSRQAAWRGTVAVRTAAIPTPAVGTLGVGTPAVGTPNVPTNDYPTNDYLTQPFYRASTFLLGVYSFCVALALTLLAVPLVRLLYGAAYTPAAQALQILSWSLPPYAYTSRVSVELVTSGRERLVLAATAASLAFTAALSLALIPAIGLNGACWSALGGETFQAVVMGLLAQRRQVNQAGGSDELSNLPG